jgi:hypothetical protein
MKGVYKNNRASITTLTPDEVLELVEEHTPRSSKLLWARWDPELEAISLFYLIIKQLFDYNERRTIDVDVELDPVKGRQIRLGEGGGGLT